ncbi:hypothetical protein M408DRAFT_312680 [Serendipita vermifera MAFF 305830]|uniref:Uncharacterized protein n=1 Tax=Serendipita vermifera MAFF 305830 TaxID=933852 RepID=A0A0C3AK86_SERVB|nr:hypothetical protein M408DRAFT_312680 [Serendipita vermifera MAFF 305830]
MPKVLEPKNKGENSPKPLSPRACRHLRRLSQQDVFPDFPTAEKQGLVAPVVDDSVQEPEQGIGSPSRDDGHDNEAWIRRRFTHLQPDEAARKRQRLRGFVFGGQWRENRRLPQDNDLDWLVHREDSKHLRCELCKVVHSNISSVRRCVKRDLNYKPRGRAE